MPKNFSALQAALDPKDHTSTILCFLRSATDDQLDVSFDLGETWDQVPTSEITDAEIIKQIDMADATYDVARLTLKDDHPRIEIAALSVQVRHLKAGRPCGCGGHGASGEGVLRYDPSHLPCRDVCAEAHGCDYVRCLVWCVVYLHR